MTTMLDPLLYRPAFDSLSGCCHLISNSLGAMPNQAREYTVEYTRIWQERGVRAWEDEWWMLPRQIGDRIGALMDAAPDSVSMHLNVTSAQATIQSCFELKSSRNKVVMLEMEFPSVLYIYHEWLRERGELRLIPSDDAVTIDTQRVIDAIDDRTLLVPMSHVLFRSSYIMDAKAIIEKAHRVGALVVLDVFQSLGSVPVDVIDLNVDFAVGGCLKWLCGGPGACFLYVRPDLQPNLRPRFTGWSAHREPFAFDIGEIDLTSGSYRFMNGTANVPALYTCRAGLEIVTEIGIDRIRERSAHMTARLIALADGRGWTVNATRDPSRRAGTVAVVMPRALEITTALKRRNILVDYRPNAGIRMSPHFYNTDDEIDFAIGQIDEIVSDATWKSHTEKRRIVT